VDLRFFVLQKRDLNWDLVFEEPFSRFWTSHSSFARKKRVCEFWDLVFEEPFPLILDLTFFVCKKRDLNWDLVFEEPFARLWTSDSFAKKEI
jgi:hypothetical protein